jgi:hypothetical protein
MGLEDWGRHTQIPAGTIRYQMERHNLPLEAALTSLGWAPQTDAPIEHHLLRITAAELRTGDHILGTEKTAEGEMVLTVRRPSTLPAPPAPSPTREHRTTDSQSGATRRGIAG